jgi:predicted NBD/HSP70 family sugar kinase
MDDHKISLLNHNSKIIRCLCYNEEVSSTDASLYTGKSIPHTIKVLSELVKDELVIESGYANSSGGRRALKYSLIPNTFYILSVSITQFDVQLAILDLNNKFVTDIVQHDLDLDDYHADALIIAINQFIKECGFKKSIIGVGITMPGFIDHDKGINYTYLQMESSLVEYIEEGISIPVFLENDSTAIALGEQKFGVALDQDEVMIANLGWGIGLGMIVDGKIFRGHSGMAGEFSHIPMVRNGKLCNCGKLGCLETEASLIAITLKAKEELKQGQTSSLSSYETINADVIINEAIKGDLLSVKLISEAAYHVGQAFAILIHIMNPATIVLSGKGSIVGKLWLAPIQQAINEHCIPRLANNTELVISQLHNKAQLIGGAVLVVENIGKPLETKRIHFNQKAIVNG